MFPLFESIRVVQGRALHLKDHQDRIRRSCIEYYGQLPVWSLKSELKGLLSTNSVMKCRLEYNLSDCHLKLTEYQKKKISRVFIREADTIQYDLKWTDRSSINELMEGLNIDEDILIVRDGMFTDSSYANLAFYDGNKWQTPKLPLLAGTCRSRLLSKGIIQEADIFATDISKYKRIRMFNSMMPWQEAIELPVSSVIQV